MVLVVPMKLYQQEHGDYGSNQVRGGLLTRFCSSIRCIVE